MSTTQPTTAPHQPGGATLQQSAQDEISIFDLWDILVRRRWWVLGALPLAVLLATAYLMLIQPVFESQSVLRLGRLAAEPITATDVLVVELRAKYDVDQSGRPYPYLSGVGKQGDDVLVLLAKGATPEEARQFLEQVVGELLRTQQQTYDQARGLREATLADVDRQLTQLNEEVDRLVSAAANDRLDPAVKALILLQSSSLKTVLPGLYDLHAEYQADLSPLKTYPPEIVRPPTLPGDQASRGLVPTLILALVAGLAFGIVMAFAVEFLHLASRRQRR